MDYLLQYVVTKVALVSQFMLNHPERGRGRRSFITGPSIHNQLSRTFLERSVYRLYISVLQNLLCIRRRWTCSPYIMYLCLESIMIYKNFECLMLITVCVRREIRHRFHYGQEGSCKSQVTLLLYKEFQVINW